MQNHTALRRWYRISSRPQQGKIFFKQVTKSTKIKKKTDSKKEPSTLKLRTLFTEDIIKRMKRQVAGVEDKIFATHSHIKSLSKPKRDTATRPTEQQHVENPLACVRSNKNTVTRFSGHPTSEGCLVLRNEAEDRCIPWPRNFTLSLCPKRSSIHTYQRCVHGNIAHNSKKVGKCCTFYL